MEYVDGPSIFELLKITTLSTDQISILGSRIMEAVATAHDLGLVHRDLKPGNILISTRNRDVFPKICDFGIAKALDTNTNPEEGSLTNTGHMMGTPAYMAPSNSSTPKMWTIARISLRLGSSCTSSSHADDRSWPITPSITIER